MKKQLSQTIIILSFLIIICSSRIIWFLGAPYFNSTSKENRQLSLRPSLSLENYSSFPNEYSAYFDDNIQFRYYLITLNSLIDFYIFDKSTNENVIKGTDGWLFYKDTLSDYQRNNLYSQSELDSIKDDVLATQEYMKNKGIEFVIFIGPNKNTIYGEYMPSYFEVQEGPSRTQQMVNYLRANTDVKIIFPTEELLKAKKEHPEIINYLKLDTHWNYMGGYWASAPLLLALDASPIDLSDISYYQVNEPDFIWNGFDEANMLGLSDFLNSDINYHVSGGLIDTVSYSGNAATDSNAFNNVILTHSNSTDKRKVFFARDSFGEAITPYIAASFSDVYSRHQISFTLDQIDEEQPDIFIFELVERTDFLGQFNYNNWNNSTTSN